ncbi:MAG: tetratricopeptide repeat protein [Rhodospirillales bacterium]|nr:tetratricopeptide repeat protein [Rhodospirillales bacterium]
MALKFIPRLSRPVGVALLALLLPTACASDSLDIEHTKDTIGEAVSGGTSLSGNYLAGRHGQANRDMPGAAKYLSKALELSPDTPDLLRRTFIMMASEGNIDEAVPLAKKVLVNNDDSPIAGLTLIVDDLKKGHFDEAKEKITRLPESGLNNYMGPLMAAWTSVALGEGVEQALAALEPLMRDGTKTLYYLHKAIIQDFMGDHEAAFKSYEDEIKEQGGVSLRVIQLLGNLYERTGQSAKAQAFYEDFAKTNPGAPVTRQALSRLKSGSPARPVIASALDGAAEGFFGIATTLSQQNARETALIFARLGLHLQPNFPVMQILLGNILQMEDQLAKANEVYEAVDPASPYSWPARLRAAENMDSLDKTDEAVRTLNAMAEEEPALSDPLVRLGDILRGRERFDEAVLAYDRAFKRIGTLMPHHWSLLYARGIVLERSDQWDRAEVDFLKALEFEPDQPFVLNYLGYSWVDKGRHLDRAKEMINKAVNLRPSDGYIVDSLGWAYFRLGEFDASAREMERAVELRPEDPILNDHLGDALWRVGRKVEARYQWQRVLTLEPTDKVRSDVESKLINGLPALPQKSE